MLIPVRCFTCGKVVGNKHERYVSMVKKGVQPGNALDSLGLKRSCCRTTVGQTIDMLERRLASDRLER